MDYDNPQFIGAVKKILRDVAEEAHQPPRAEQPTEYPDVKEELTTPSVRTFHVSDSLIDRIKRQSAHEQGHEWRKDFLEMAMVGIVLVYAIVTWLQWQELDISNLNQSAAITSSGVTADRTLMQGRDAIKQSQHALETQERAWLGAEAELSQRTNTAFLDTIDYRVTLTNAGHSPALKVVVRPGWVVLRRKFVIASDFSATNRIILNPHDPSPSVSVVLQGSTIKSPKFGFNIHHPPASLVPAGTKPSWLFLLGDVTYDDAFGNRRRTSYCYRLEEESLIMCNMHNDMR